MLNNYEILLVFFLVTFCLKLQILWAAPLNFSLYVLVFSLLCPFLIGTEKVIYFSVFSPKQSNWPLNSSAYCLTIRG